MSDSDDSPVNASFFPAVSSPELYGSDAFSSSENDEGPSSNNRSTSSDGVPVPKRRKTVPSSSSNSCIQTETDSGNSYYSDDDCVPQELCYIDSVNQTEVISGILYLWASTSGVSDKALDRLLKLQACFNTQSQWPVSVKSLQCSVQRHFNLGEPAVSTFYVCGACDSTCSLDSHRRTKVIIPSLSEQIILLLSQHASSIYEYQSRIAVSLCSDILNSKYAITKCLPKSKTRTLELHLLMCADGAKYIKTSPLSIWPVQAQVLNMPPLLRQTFWNTLLVAVVESNNKPDFELIFPHLFSVLPRTIEFRGISVRVHFSFFTADLPAMSSIFGLTQFNGAFSCPKCLHPGETIPVSEKGHVRCFKDLNIDIDERDKENFLHHAELSEVQGIPVFGVRKKASILKEIPFPDAFVIDSMHCLFEGQSKQILQELLNAKNRYDLCYLSPEAARWSDAILRSCKGPKLFSTPPGLSSLSVWKAKHFRNCAMYMFIPILSYAASNLDLKFFLISLSLLYNLLFHSSSSSDDMDFLSYHVLSKVPILFGDRNMRLNFHLLSHFPSMYVQYGPICNISMFGFESAIGKFKSFLKGTRCYGGQLATKVLNAKKISCALASSDSITTRKAFQAVSMESDSVLFCTAKDDMKRKSCNSFVLTKDGHVGEIQNISADDNVTLKLFKPCENYLFYLELLQMNDEQKKLLKKLQTIIRNASLLYKCFSNIFDLDQVDSICQTRLSDLSAPCLLIPCKKSTCSNAFFIIPVYEYMHD